MSGVSTATIIAGASAAASIASAGMSIIGGMQSGAATGAANTANMVIGQQNAQLARDQAAADAQDIALSNRKSIASLRATAGASGLLVEDGSPLEAIVASAGAGELNRQRRLWQGELDARNAELGGYAAQRTNNQMSTYAAAGSSLLTGVSKVNDLLSSTSSRPPSPFGGPNAPRPD